MQVGEENGKAAEGNKSVHRRKKSRSIYRTTKKKRLKRSWLHSETENRQNKKKSRLENPACFFVAKNDLTKRSVFAFQRAVNIIYRDEKQNACMKEIAHLPAVYILKSAIRWYKTVAGCI